MKRLSLATLLLAFSGALLFAQTPGFTGDVNEITKRILSSTRYRLTPGDTYNVVITMGGTVTSYSLVLTETYDLDVPYVGTLNVKGSYFTDLRKLLTERLKRLLPMAEFIAVGLQSPARFDVSVFGAVEGPGIVTVSPLSRVSDAIALARGVKKGATVRQIRLTRGDRTLKVDLFLYARNDGSDANPYLEPGDTVFVPQTAVLVTVAGMVRYPGPYEIVPGESLKSLLEYSGGALPEARPGAADILRYNRDGKVSRLSVDLAQEPEAELRDGDAIRIPAMLESRETVLMSGGLYGAPQTVDKPMAIPAVPVTLTIPYLPGMTLLKALEAVGGPTPYARAREGVIVKSGTKRRIVVDMETLWASRSPEADIPLEPGDSVSVPMVNQVFVVGEVRSGGKVPYLPGSTVTDYIAASGGVNEVTGDPNAVFFVDTRGNRTRANPTDAVAPGAVIFVDKNFVYANQQLFNNITIYTAFLTAIITFTSTVVSFINSVR
jgi:polysaccharide biosynthesis/export protein